MQDKRIYMKIYYRKNKKRLQEYAKIYYKVYDKTPKRKRYFKQYRKEHTKQIKNYYTKNKKKILKQKKIYYQKNKQVINKKVLNKLKSNINFRIRIYLSNRIRSALKYNWKSRKTLKLLGCSIEKLKQHLKKKFKRGMNWKNYGKWELDHIKPCAKFNLRKKSEQYKCFNYKNLQPLWSHINRSKQDN